MNKKQMLHTTLPIGQLMPHPKNVRKNVGDVSELAASIAAQGIMQNLLVVPEPGHEITLDSFWVVIGNRRLAAAKAAGLEKLPCTIAEGLEEQEQIELMLIENIQRCDLTPQEEAQAYEQLTLDFGLSAEQISAKTGVSASTIRRRLKINELDPDVLREKEFQVSLGDYAALEKIKDKDRRNQVLENAESSANLRYLADLEVEKEERRENMKPLIEFILQTYDVEIVDRNGPNFRYIGSLFVADTLEASKDRICKLDIQCYDRIYIDDTAGVTYLYGHSIEAEETGSGKQLTRAELLEQKRERDHKFVLKHCREMAEARQAFIIRVINGEFRLPDGMTPQEAQERLWTVLRGIGSPTMDIAALTAYWTHSEEYQVFDRDKELMAEKPMWVQMLASAGYSTRRSDYLCRYSSHEYNTQNGETLQRLVGLLKSMGFSLQDQEQQMILEGSHDCWEQKK